MGTPKPRANWHPAGLKTKPNIKSKHQVVSTRFARTEETKEIL